jgi:hypothetical protein
MTNVWKPQTISLGLRHLLLHSYKLHRLKNIGSLWDMNVYHHLVVSVIKPTHGPASLLQENSGHGEDLNYVDTMVYPSVLHHKSA